MDIFSLVGKITINYADAVNNIEKVSKSAKDTAETLEDVDKKADGAGDSVEDAGQAAKNADSGFTRAKAGDIIMFANDGYTVTTSNMATVRTHHTAIYMGNGYIAEASGYKKGIIYSKYIVKNGRLSVVFYFK